MIAFRASKLGSLTDKLLPTTREHERLEGVFSTPVPDYGIRDVLRAYRHPFKTDEALGDFGQEVRYDMTIKPYLPRNARVRGSGLALGLAGFGIAVGPHEAMHAVTTRAVGGSCEEIVFNRLYGGDLWAAVVPGAEAKMMIPLIGGYVKPAGLDTWAQNMTMFAAPYIVLAPLGIYCAMKARERRSLPLAMLSTGIAAGNVGAQFGDLRAMMYHTGDALAEQVVSGHQSTVKDPSLVGLLASFVVASYAVKGLYRLTRGAVNDGRRLLGVKTAAPKIA